MSCTVSPITLNDIENIVSYWTKATPEDFARMGVDPAVVPTADIFRKNLESLVATPMLSRKVTYLIWKVNEQSIGYSSLKNVHPGKHAEIHLHMWNANARGKGYGGKLFCLSALNFYETFTLKEIFCEPRSSNPMPNRMLQKIGFPLVKTYWAKSSELSLYCELNRYLISKETASVFLLSRSDAD